MKFWEVNNLSNSEGELVLYGEIRSSKPWWSEGQMITPEEFLNDIALLRNKSKITVRINSRGGDVFAAQSIYASLKDMPANIEIIIEGIAASAATIITCAGDTVKISPGSAFMIHNPSVTVFDSFQASDLEQLKSMLDSVKNCIIETYCTKTSLSKQELSQMMDDEVWLTGRQAVEKGFCDELMHDTAVTNSVLNGRMILVNNIAHDFSGFKNMPVFEPVAIEEPPKGSTLGEHEDVQNEKTEVIPAKVIQNIGGNTRMTVEELKAQHPDLVNQIQNATREEAIKGERDRIQAIEQISNSVSKELVENAKYLEPINAQELAFKALQDASKKGQQFLNNLQEDSTASGTTAVNATAEITKEENEDEEAKALAAVMNKDTRRIR